MKRWFAVFVTVALVLSGVAWAEEKYNPGINHTGVIGETGKYWRLGGFDKFQMPEITAPSDNPPSNSGWVYIKDTGGGVSNLYFEADDGTVIDLLAATAWDDLVTPDANKTHAFTTFTSTFTGTSTVADQWTFRGTGNFGDVSVVKVESLTGNPTDGTVLEVVSHDTDADALLVTANAINSIQVVGSGNLNLLGGTGTVTFTDWAFTADGLFTLTPDLGGTAITITPSAALTTGLDVSNVNITNGVDLGATKLLGTTAVIDFTNFDVSAAGAITATGGLSSGSAADSFIYTDTIELSNANIKALRATPITLVAAPGADKFVEVISVVLILDYGTNVLTETTDNLVVEYNTSGVDITGAIEATGFIDAAADTIKIAYPIITDVSAANTINLAVQLFNTGDGEYAGNAANDTTMTAKVNYRIHAAGL